MSIENTKNELIEYIKNILGENDLLFNRFKKSILTNNSKEHFDNLEILHKKYDYETFLKINDAFYYYSDEINFYTTDSFNPQTTKEYDSELEYNNDLIVFDFNDQINLEKYNDFNDINSKSWIDLLIEKTNVEVTYPNTLIDDIFKK